jgi:hypothetical protein
MRKRISFVVVLIVVLGMAISACGSTSHSTDPAVNQAKSQVNAVASTPANTAAENDAKALVKPCVSPYENQPLQLLKRSARKTLAGCIKALVPVNKRTQVYNCALRTAAHDRIWKKSGWKQFEDTDAATCVVQATKA